MRGDGGYVIGGLSGVLRSQYAVNTGEGSELTGSGRTATLVRAK